MTNAILKSLAAVAIVSTVGAAPAVCQSEPVAWTATWGTTASGGTLTKTGADGWNAGAVSTKSILSGDGYVEFSATDATTDVVCGLARNGQGQGYWWIDYAVRLASDGSVKIVESGVVKAQPGSYGVGDLLRVAIVSGVVRYYQNQNLLYTSTVTPSYPLLVDAALFTADAAIDGAVLSGTLAENVVWTNVVNAAVLGNNLAKPTGTNAWDAGAVSTRGIVSQDGYVEWVASETGGSRTLGLSHGDSSQNYADIDFGLTLYSSGLYVQEAGITRASVGTFAAGDHLRVSVEGGVVKYRKNGTLLYTSTVAPTFPLLVDTSVYSVGATLTSVVLSGDLAWVSAPPPAFSAQGGRYDSAQTVVITESDPAAVIHYATSGADPTESDPVIVSGESVVVNEYTVLKARAFKAGVTASSVTAATYTFGTVTTESVAWTSVVNAVALVNNLAKTGGANGALDAGATSTRGIASQDGYVEFVASETGTSRVLGLSHGDSNQSLVDIDFGLQLYNGGLYVVESGVTHGSFGTYVTGDHLRVSVEGGVVRYRKNGTLLYTSSVAPTLPLLVDTSLAHVGATLTGVVLSGELTWVAVPPPTLSVQGGHYDTAQSVVITESDPAAVIHYTTSGADPTTSDPVIASGDSVVVNQYTVLKARASKAGLIASSVTAATYTFGTVVTENVVWTNVVNAVALGDNLTKSAGVTGAWDAGAASTRGIVSQDGYVEWVASETSTNRRLGLSHGDSDQNYTDIDFTLLLYGGALYVCETGVQHGPFGTYATGDHLRVSVEGGVVTYRKNGALLYTSTVAPTFPLLVDTALQNVGATLTGVVLSGELVWVAVPPPTFSVAPGHYDAAQSVMITESDSAAVIHYTTSGADPTESDPVIGSGDSVLVGQYMVLKARAFKAGLIPSSVTAAMYTFGPVVTENVVWTNVVNVVALGSNLTKSAGTEGWNAGAVSTRGIVSMDGYVESVVSDAYTYRMLGLSHGDGNQTQADIDFGLFLYGNNLYVYEAGVQHGPFGTFAIGDHLRVSVEGGVVNYRKNGTLLYTSSVAPTFPLLVDTSLYHVGGMLTNVVLSGELAWVAVSPPTFSVQRGHYDSAQTVTIAGGDPASVIHCTTSGADPTESDPVIGSGDSVLVGQYMVLKARAFKAGLIPSSVTAAMYTFGPVVTENVVWTNVVNVVAQGNNLSKPTGTSGWNAGAISTRGIASLDGYVEWVASETGPSRTLGLSHGDTSQSLADIDFGLTLYSSGLYVQEMGITRATVGTFAPGDHLRVSVEGGVVKYRKNGVLLYASAVAPTFPLLVDTTLYDLGTTLTNVVISGELVDMAVAAPQFSVAGGVYSAPQTIAITSTTPGAAVHYTTNGIDPTEADPILAPGSTLALAQNATLKARAWKSEYFVSSISTVTYGFQTAAPVLAPGPGSYAGSVTVTATTVTPGATIHCTADNTLPTESSPVCSSAITFNATTTLRAVAFRSGWPTSPETAGTYVVTANTLASPTITPAPGTYGAPVLATLAAAAGATIHYTLDNTAPTCSSPVYATPLALTSTTTVRALACEDGWLPSDTVAAAYAIQLGAVAAGESFSLALRPDGTLWAWGDNQFGQFGNGTTDSTPSPSQTTGLSGVLSIAVGRAHALALRSDGTVWTWGANEYGQVGNGTTATQTSPQQIGLTDIVAVSAGWEYSLALKSDGTVWAWGVNDSGQLGNGTTAQSDTPVQVSGLSNVVAIAGAWVHGLALRSDGTVWAWGDNGVGGLGNGDGPSSLVPVQIESLSNVVAIASGAPAGHSFAVKSDGTVWAWGLNNSGELGLGTFTDKEGLPGQVVGLSAVTRLSAGSDHSLAVAMDGTVWAWGGNWAGQLGDGTYTDRAVPTAVAGPTNAISVAAGSGHSLALTADGMIWAWGANWSGQLGDATWEQRLTPFRAMAPDGARMLPPPSFDHEPGVYITSLDVTIWWTPDALVRYTTDGSEPNETSSVYSTPIALTTTTTLKAREYQDGWLPSVTRTATYEVKVATPSLTPAGGTYAAAQNVSFTCATPGAVVHYTTTGADPTEADTVIAEGASIPIAATSTVKARAFKSGLTPSDTVSADYSIVFLRAAVAAGGSHSLALKEDGTVWAWGDNSIGQLGLNDYDGRLTPTLVPELSGIVAIAAGRYHSLALKSDGTVVAWGYNGNGQLGVGDTDSRTTPTAVAGLTDVVAISAGGYYSLALKRDGTVVAWGGNWYGALGLGDFDDRSVPTPIGGLQDVTAISAGEGHSLALKGDGTVMAWGDNSGGDLGVGGWEQRNAPTLVADLVNVSAISAGNAYSLAVKHDGTVIGWGVLNMGGGDAAEGFENPTPVTIVPLSGITAVAAGDSQSLALTESGNVIAWGRGGAWRGGGGTYEPTIESLPALASVRRISAGSSQNFALTGEGVAWAWGDNTNGQIGDGTYDTRPTPVRLSEPGMVWKTATPTFAPAGGPVTDAQTVAITCYAAGASIHYTTNGAEPTESDPTPGPGQSASVEVTGSMTIRAKAWADGQPPSNTAVGFYCFPLAVPTFSLPAGTYSSEQDVQIFSSDPGTSIQYTKYTFGYSDTETGTIPAGGSVHVSVGTYVAARAVATGCDPSPSVEADYELKVRTPVLTPPAGTYPTHQTIGIATATPGAQVHYTTNGTVAYSAAPVYVGPFSFETGTVRAVAIRPGWTDSDEATAVYRVIPTPRLSPNGGTFFAPTTVTFAPLSSGEAHCTLDGSEPTTTSPLCPSSFDVDSLTTIRARVVIEGYWGAEATETYAFKVATPTASSGSGTYANPVTLRLATTSPGAAIHYRTDGAEPTDADLSVVSGETIAIGSTATLKVKAMRGSWLPSDTVTLDIRILAGTVEAPMMDPPPGAYAQAQSVMLASVTEGAVVYYTLDGSEPSVASSIFATPIAIAESTTVRARAFKQGFAPSTTVTSSYLIGTARVASPLFTPPPGHYFTTQLVTVASATPDAVVRYTTDGSEPTAASEAFPSTGLSVDRWTRLKAGAWKTGMEPSAAVTGDFSISGEVVAGANHTLVLRNDGTMWSWGANDSGQLGDGTTDTRTAPVPVSAPSTMTGVTAVAAGGAHSLALTSGGALWAWGDNSGGQVGDGTTEPRPVPVLVSMPPTMTGVIAIAAGVNHSLALTSDGTVWAWGANAIGQLGDGTTETRTAPVPVSTATGMPGITRIAAGGEHSLALSASGAVWAWGRNAEGQLGNAALTPQTSPISVAGFTSTITALAAGDQHSLALDSDGLAWAWGRNDEGELGLGSTGGTHTAPAPIVRPAGLGKVVGLAAGKQHSLAWMDDGRAWSWGANGAGQLGVSAGEQSATPMLLPVLREVVSLGGGDTHSVALAVEGHVWTWGGNDGGQLGDGDTLNRTQPASLASLTAAPNDHLLLDPDNDGLTTAAELRLGTDPYNADTNGDGVPDGLAVRLGISPTSLDTDGDGISNRDEIRLGTNPLRADTDGDGVPDGMDAFPLDPTRWDATQPDSSDHTPPTITLWEPENAIPLH
jgi:alpha-tubulin suppressor-like RCC1 family protein